MYKKAQLITKQRWKGANEQSVIISQTIIRITIKIITSDDIIKSKRPVYLCMWTQNDSTTFGHKA